MKPSCRKVNTSVSKIFVESKGFRYQGCEMVVHHMVVCEPCAKRNAVVAAGEFAV